MTLPAKVSTPRINDCAGFAVPRAHDGLDVVPSHGSQRRHLDESAIRGVRVTDSDAVRSGLVPE
ncbi:hypothetical protein CEE78_11860, partial [Lactobacillus crispatus]